jgi:RNA polymerase sigma-70 factor (ECF subfamily)
MTALLTRLDDAGLAARVAAGDDAALAVLYDRHAPTCYRLALRVARDRGVAEEAVQDGFLGFWREAARFDPARGAVAGFLVLLVRRRAIDLVRRSEHRRADPLPDDYDAVEPGAEELVGDRLRHEAARALLTAIPDRERELLELAYFDGFTQSELAERLALPLGTVKSRMHAGLARLRELLEADADTLQPGPRRLVAQDAGLSRRISRVRIPPGVSRGG